MSVEQRIRARLAALDPVEISLEDDSARHAGHAGAAPSGETHWKLRIVSARFEGMSTVARHRAVYSALGSLMQNPIHALEIHARAPREPDASR